ncbi:GNAT family N-acetyltransferase [Microlunatus capsulatus]|uniref:GNAT family acetyltransferase n=1 Tax=Microlunatus capsulatus TaxID=99117 RepID=A0ABS4ZD54_9ACTN|nr:GNAT family N-acetyltransferase [Microlunatus capsulatus]MBP2418662.1 putative GNAT family acetyltransferase [Microlunatus capsulatus]
MSDDDQDGRPAVRVTRDDDRSRYQGLVDGEPATVIDFTRRGDVLVFTHTGTDPRFRGRGLAGATTRQALEDVRAAGLAVEPLCSFTVRYFAEHPEVADLHA